MKQNNVTIDFSKPLYVIQDSIIEQVDIIDLKNGKFMTYQGHVFSIEDEIILKN